MDELVVVELAGSVAGAQTAKLFGDLGAQVVCIEPEGGAPLRRDDAQWLAFATSRQCVDAGTELAAQWLAKADVVIESSAEGALAGGLLAVPSTAVHVVITPFGNDGPYARWRSCDIVDQALGGHLYLSGRPDREPLQSPSGQAALAAGVWAAIGAMAALLERRVSGRGQRVDATHHEALAAMHQFTDLRWTHARNVLTRMGNRYAGPGSPIGMYRASDGWVAFTVATAAHGEMLLALTGLTDLLELPGINSLTDLMVNAAVLDPALNGWLAQHTVAEAVDLLQAGRLAVGPVLTMTQLLDDEHLAEREWWQTVDHAGRTLTLPGAPFRIGSLDWTTTPPRIADAAPADPPPVPGALPVADAAERKRPLEGLRVLDLTRVWAGPLCARILSDLGADVVMVEALWQRTPRVVPQSYVDASHFYPNDNAGDEPWNTQGFVNKYAVGKQSIGLDLAVPEGRAVLERLVASADVLIENFSPRVMPNLGLDEDRLHEINPALIYVTMPGYGRSGPASEYSAYGPVLDSHAGLSTLMGYPDVDAWKCGIAWPDPVGGIHGAFSILAALWARERSGGGDGTTIEIAQLETAITMVSDRLLRAQIDGRNPDIIGNRHPQWAPHGVFRCAGDDRWVVIAVPDDRAWVALCTAADLPATWQSWDVEARRANEQVIDDAISAWTASLDRHDVTAALQSNGVLAGPVADARDMVEDPQLASRDFYVEIDHRLAGRHAWHRVAFRLDATPVPPTAPAPCLGEHNRSVLGSWAGYADVEIDRLLATGVIGTEPTE